MNPLPTLAKIPLLDWSGSEFLKFYGFTLVIAIIWSWIRTRTVMRNFETLGAAETPTDPYELAYLAAGEPRVAQLAVASLIQKKSVQWKSGPNGKCLMLKSEKFPGHLPEIEEALLASIYQTKPDGLPLTKVIQCLAPYLRAIEVKLAAAGLRPTTTERNKARPRAVYPLIWLGLIGVPKVFLGLSRDKPVGLLLLLLCVTGLAACIIGSRTRRLTPSGERLLSKSRNDYQATRRSVSKREAEELPILSTGVALFGPAILASSAAFAGIHQELRTPLGGANGNTPSGGCGTGSSGCGSSGDGGGGGCGGGCGGCGGD